MLLHRCSRCGLEYLPNGVHATWHKHIGRIPRHILRAFFCHCKQPSISRSEQVMLIDYDDLKQAIIEVGKSMTVREEQS